MAYVPDSLSSPDAPDAPRGSGVLSALFSRAVIAPIAAVIVFLAFWEFLGWINDWPN